MAAKNKRSVTIIAGWITGAAAIIAAIIGISPSLIGLGVSNNKLVTVTPISFIKYDDPVGEFSIEYPSDFYISQRSYSNLFGLSIFFDTKGDKAQVVSSVIVTFIKSVNPNIDYQAHAKSQVLSSINGNDDYREDTAPVLISSEKTSRGYYMHFGFDCGSCSNASSHTFILMESEYDILATVRVFARADELSGYDSSIVEHIIRSFKWSFDPVYKMMIDLE